MSMTAHRSRFKEHAFRWLCLTSIVIPLAILAALLTEVGVQGIGRLDMDFLRSYPSRKPELAGILPALAGSAGLVIMTALISIPLGIGAAIYLEEYGGRSRISRLVETNIANLAAVPSIIYGLLGLGIFVRMMRMDRSLIAGACTLSLLIMPIIVVASREALRTVPNHLREAGFGLGSTRWQIIRRVVLPMALPGMMTGSILAISRAIGETAPLIVVGALTYITFLPDGINAPYSALPIQIYNWVSRPQEAFVINASAGIVVLLGTMLTVNLVAVVIRSRLQKRLG
jgi:phosphate transport system permease protein